MPRRSTRAFKHPPSRRRRPPGRRPSQRHRPRRLDRRRAPTRPAGRGGRERAVSMPRRRCGCCRSSGRRIQSAPWWNGGQCVRLLRGNCRGRGRQDYKPAAGIYGRDAVMDRQYMRITLSNHGVFFVCSADGNTIGSTRDDRRRNRRAGRKNLRMSLHAVPPTTARDSTPPGQRRASSGLDRP